MARVTVEDCLSTIANRFNLIVAASRRARQIALGSEPLVPWNNDKPTVLALREVADQKIDRFGGVVVEQQSEQDEDKAQA